VADWLYKWISERVSSEWVGGWIDGWNKEWFHKYSDRLVEQYIDKWIDRQVNDRIIGDGKMRSYWKNLCIHRTLKTVTYYLYFMSRTITDVQMVRHFIDSHPSIVQNHCLNSINSMFSSIVNVDGPPDYSSSVTLLPPFFFRVTARCFSLVHTESAAAILTLLRRQYKVSGQCRKYLTITYGVRASTCAQNKQCRQHNKL
jgi:hypothetical protein